MTVAEQLEARDREQGLQGEHKKRWDILTR